MVFDRTNIDLANACLGEQCEFCLGYQGHHHESCPKKLPASYAREKWNQGFSDGETKRQCATCSDSVYRLGCQVAVSQSHREDLIQI